MIFYLEDHGASSFKELNEALGISYGSLWNIFNRLIEKGFPIVKIRKEDQLNENFKYFGLKRPNPIENIFEEQGEQGRNQLRQLIVMLQELHKWYEYFALNAFMKYIPTHEWIELKGLDNDFQFNKLLKKWGLDFQEAIDLLLKNEVLYVRRNEDVITHVKRAFDNYGKRIEEEIQISELVDVDKKLKLDPFSLEDFYIE